MTPVRDMLIKHRNKFQQDFVDNSLDLKRHLAIQKETPDYVREDKNTGKDVRIEKIIEEYVKAAKNAKFYLDIINEVLAITDEQQQIDALVAVLAKAEETEKSE